MYRPIYPGSYYFNTFTFTSMGNSGHIGPTSNQTYADAPWPSSSYFSIKNGQQNWTVPANGVYQITAAGAYGATPGRVVTGQATLSQGQTLTMLVGQQPTPLTANVLDNVTVGGAGGTFVTTNGTPLIVASGGDGSGPTSSPGSFTHILPPVHATGGTVTTYTSGGTTYKVHTFTSDGSFVVTYGGAVDILVVGGGGAPLNYYYDSAGGGGGGYVTITSTSVSSGSIPVVIGTGGYSTPIDLYPPTWSIVNGTASSFGAFTASPGGNATFQTYQAVGGASQSGSPGSSVTRVGGAGAGSLPPTGYGIQGGDGISSDISGTLTYYGGGGGGSYLSLYGLGGLGGGGEGSSYYNTATDGAPNSGGGGGGDEANSGTSARGGTGIVIVRYTI